MPLFHCGLDLCHRSCAGSSDSVQDSDTHSVSQGLISSSHIIFHEFAICQGCACADDVQVHAKEFVHETVSH